MPDSLLHTYLAEQDVPCPGCAYNLRGLTGTRCPECNQELQLRVGLVEPRMAAFIAGLVGISVGFGFCTMLLVWVGYMYWGRPNWRAPMSDFYPLFFGVIAGAGLLWTWLRSRARLNRCEPGVRWMAALVATLLALVGPIWFMITVR